MKKFLTLLLMFLVSVSFAAKPLKSKSPAQKKSVSKSALAASSKKAAKKQNAKKDEFRDSRDRETYRIVKIGNRVWLRDNLNFKADNSFCLDDDENNCMAYGRLYTWESAQKACPAGFRLPVQADFEDLWNAAGADFNAGYLLKTNYGWKGETNGNDTLKFSAMAVGNRFDDETYGNMSKFAFFWSGDDSLEGIESGNARVWYLTNKSMAFGYTSKSKKFGFSVRCVKDAE